MEFQVLLHQPEGEVRKRSCGESRALENNKVTSILLRGSHLRLFCKSLSRKGEMFAYVGRIRSLKDRRDFHPEDFKARGPLLQSERKQGFFADYLFERAMCSPMLSAFET